MTFTHLPLRTLEEPRVSFRSTWRPEVSRPWPGPEYWSNPLQDWRIRQGRLECFSPGGDRNVALLTRVVSERSGDLRLAVRLGQIGAGPLESGFVGFRVGIKHKMEGYRAAAIYGGGMHAGISADGRLFIGTLENGAPRVDLAKETQLELHATPFLDRYKVLLRASHSGSPVAEITREVSADWLVGGLALVCSSGEVEPTPATIVPPKDFSFYPPQQPRISILESTCQPSGVRRHLYLCGFERDEDTPEVYTQWVTNKISRFSSLSMLL